MSENIVFAVLFFPAVVFVLVFGMKYLSAVLQARARMGHDDTYRAMAAQAAQAQADAAAAIAAQGAVLADIQGRLAGLEKILKQVE
jgi:dipeptide/tripeptide permease